MRQSHTPVAGCSPAGGPVGDGTLTDAELLTRWRLGSDPAALEAFVRRHGAMVLGVCRRVLGHTPDAEDAFQATFLVFVEKGKSLARPAEVAGWLHGVALRVARKARAVRARRRQREVAIVALTDPPVPEPPEDARELRRVLDEELDRLPEKYRLPIVLCELEGRTLDEAARLLGWPKGTVAGRLSRGRDLLRQRLSRRRGLVLPLFLSGGPATLAPAPVPDPLVSATVATASGAGGPGSAPTTLAAAIIRAANRMRLGLILLLLLLPTGLLAAYAWGGGPAAATPQNPPAPPPATQPAAGGCHSQTS